MCVWGVHLVCPRAGADAMLGAGTGLSRGLWAQAFARTTTLLCQEDPRSRDLGAEIPGTGSLE